jgi:hypothetical protein
VGCAARKRYREMALFATNSVRRFVVLEVRALSRPPQVDWHEFHDINRHAEAILAAQRFHLVTKPSQKRRID